MKDFMKMHIIGCSGSGKTYLANALSKKHNIPHFDLDDIQWDNSAEAYGTKRPLDKRKALLQEILSNNDWILRACIIPGYSKALMKRIKSMFWTCLGICTKAEL